MKCEVSVTQPVIRSARVQQVEGMFDLPPAERIDRVWKLSLPIESPPAWNVGLIVGPSGSGKSTVARAAFADGGIVSGFDWDASRSIVDGFPAGMPILEITGLLSSVGFSSPPNWVRPFFTLSNGEQFRVTLARALADPREVVCIDEFTSVVDRQVAQVASCAVAKAVRRMGRKFVAISCHSDIVDWLDPDWILEMPSCTFSRRLVRRRPPIGMEIVRVDPSAWELFKAHHYLTGDHHKAATCFCGLIGGRPVAYCSVLHFPHQSGGFWKEHRTVCLPDFQGIGIGNAISEYVASLFVATGKKYRGVTLHPALCNHRKRSPLWKLVRAASLNRPNPKAIGGLAGTHASTRMTASYEYVGKPNPEDARRFGVLK